MQRRMRMTRSFSALVVLAVAAAFVIECNAPICGTGTVQRQRSDGTTVCLPADQSASNTPCDDAPDGGSSARNQDGICVSRTVCDPNTTMVVTANDGSG